MARVLGLDIGIGSCGWAVVELPEIDPETGEIAGEFAILGCGVRGFQVPEEPDTRELKNKQRRQKRGQRRVIARRRLRMRQIRRLLREQGLPADPGPLPPGSPHDLVWRLRVEGLSRLLAPAEWARVLIHIARHRGFRATSKRDRNRGAESRLAATPASEPDESLTYAQRVMRIAAAEGCYRNRVGRSEPTPPSRDEVERQSRARAFGVDRTPLRDEVEREAQRLFEVQRRFGNPATSPDFERQYRHTAFSQRPLQGIAELVGRCRFLPEEKRAPKQAPSFELFRFLQSLAHLRLVESGSRERPLGAEERRQAESLFATRKHVTYAQLRKRLGLAQDVRFAGLVSSRKNPARKSPENPEDKTFASCEGSHLLAEALGSQRFFQLLDQAPEQLDRAAEILIREEDIATIRQRLAEAGFRPEEVSALTRDEVLDTVSGFKGVGHISTAACRRLIPHLREGLSYTEACAREGWDATAEGDLRLEDVRNPVVQKILRESLKQIDVVVREFGEPDRVHLEMARDIGKSPFDRRAIARAIQERTKERNDRAKEFENLLNRQPNDEELLRFELWKEQGGRCPYTFPDESAYIPVEALIASDNRVQVDHIYPYSRSGDDSFRNKVLCWTSANQQKRRRTPFEWFSQDRPDLWEAFEKRVQHDFPHMHKEKKRKLLARSFAERETEYRRRHLNDTRYAMRVLASALRQRFPTVGTRRVFARPGQITAIVRRAWGLDSLKRNNELGDRDHALDAIVVACTSESLLNRLTRLHQRLEELGRGRLVPEIQTPLGSSSEARERFRTLVKRTVEAVLVSRSETRRGRGPLHGDTLYAFTRLPDNSEIQYERKYVWELTRADLDRLKDHDTRGRRVREALEEWFERAERAGIDLGKTSRAEKLQHFWRQSPPRIGQGPAIRRVRLKRRTTAGIKLRRGEGVAHADQETMVRIDVFEHDGKYSIVPIYAWQLALLDSPPNRAVTRGKGEDEWEEIGPQHRFLWSLYPGSFVVVETRDGKLFQGYFRSFDRSNGGIAITPPHDWDSRAIQRFGSRTLARFEKWQVDRLGRRSPIASEVRTWRGEPCS